MVYEIHEIPFHKITTELSKHALLLEGSKNWKSEGGGGGCWRLPRHSCVTPPTEKFPKNDDFPRNMPNHVIT